MGDVSSTKIMFWFLRIGIILIPVGLSYWKNFSKDKKMFRELIDDGQVCFIAFSIAASSVVNILAMWFYRQKLNACEVIIFFILFALAFLSTGFFQLFDITPFAKENNQDDFNRSRKIFRHQSIEVVLEFIAFFSYIVDVIWY